MKPSSTKYSVEDLQAAISAVKDEGMSYKQASKVFNIPTSTIYNNANNPTKKSKNIYSTISS